MKEYKRILELLIAMLFFIIMSLTLYKQSYDIKIPRVLNYEEKGNINYKVYLSDSKYYNKEYLQENMQYISSIIDYIDLNFNYDLKFDESIEYNINTKATADIQIMDTNNEKIIYNSKEVLSDKNSKSKKNEKNINIDENLKIDYKKYNNLTNEFKSNYGINANCKLIINYYIEYQGKYKSFNNIKQNKKMSIELPLSEQMISITKTPDFNDKSSYVEDTNKTLANKTLLIISIIFMLTAVIILIIIIRIVLYLKGNEDKYEKYIKKILRQYDSYITESKEDINIKGKTIINISSFKELLDVRNNIEKAIIYVKLDESHSKFLIIDEDEIYSYNLSSKEFE